MSKLCRYCNKPIPEGRHGSAKYCNYEHYYFAKKKRSNKQYHIIKEPYAEIKKNESLLAEIYRYKKTLGKTVTMNDLHTLGFDLGISSTEVKGKQGTIWKKVGGYAYYINPSNSEVSIWKF